MTDTAANPTRADDPSLARQVTASLAACERIVRSRARNFWFGLRMTPRPRRDALYALYAWMRLGDDLVDEPAPLATARAHFHDFASATKRVLDDPSAPPAALASHSGPQPLPLPDCWPAFAWLLRSFPIQRSWLEAMLAGLESDLTHTPFQTQAQLDLYRHRVAGTVGMCCVAIWGLRAGIDQRQAWRLANQRGMAFQMVNILRDIGRDARDAQPRTYIPADLLAAHGLTQAQLVAWANPPRCEDLIQQAALIAIRDFMGSSQLAKWIAPDCVPVLCTMSDIYSTLLVRLRDDPRRCVMASPTSLPAWRKAIIAARWSLFGASRAERTEQPIQHGAQGE
jgi:phytoene synthase